MPTEHSDGDLLSACTEGESWAWNALVERYQGLVYSIPLRANLTQEDAEDVFQMVFSRMLRYMPSIREPRALAKWLITTANRVTDDVLSRRLQELPEADLPRPIGSAAPRTREPRHDEDRLIKQALIRDAVERLGGLCRKLLYLLFFDPAQPSYEQVGHRLKIPLGSVGPTRARCLKKLRDILLKIGGGEW